jgi:hypothetical protein
MNCFMNKLLFALPLLAASGNAVGDSPNYAVINYNSVMCLDVAGVSTANGAKVHQWTCHNGANQQWSVAGPGGGFPVPGNQRYQIRNRHSGKCLEVAGASTSRGATVRQWTCNGGLNQLWLVDFP